MSKYVLDSTKTAIIDINPDKFKGNSTILFPTEVDGHKITNVNISVPSLKKLESLFKSIDVVIEDGIDYMEHHMFAGSKIIRSISIPASMQYIPECCFKGSSITEVIFQDESLLEEICGGAFSGCKELKSISLPETVNEIGVYSFKSSGLVEITLPCNKDHLHIGESAFTDCFSLERVTFPEINVDFGRRVFSGCNHLKAVEMSKAKIESIPTSLFSGCFSLKEVTLPSTVSVIGEGAFYSCSSLTTVGLGKTEVHFVMSNAFENCTSYSDGEFPYTINVIDNNAFARCNISKLSLPLTALKKVGNHAFSGNPLDEEFSLLPFVDCETLGDHIFSKCGFKTLQVHPFSGDYASAKFLFKDCSNLEEVKMEDFAYLTEGMFMGCTNLKSVTLPNTLTEIALYSFIDCGELRHVEFPKSIINIGESAFQNTELEELNLSSNESIEIEAQAFTYTSLGSVKLPSYCCTVYENSFPKSIMNDIIKEYPFLNVIAKFLK